MLPLTNFQLFSSPLDRKIRNDFFHAFFEKLYESQFASKKKKDRKEKKKIRRILNKSIEFLCFL